MYGPGLILIGGGGHALVVADAARRCGLVPVGVYDDQPEPELTRRLGVPRLGRALDLPPLPEAWDPQLTELTVRTPGYILALGDLAARSRVLAAIGPGLLRHAAIVRHPAAVIEPTARIGNGTYVGPTAVVHSFALIGPHCIVNSAAVVEHECDLASNVHVAPGAILGGRARVGPDTLLGIGARVLPGVSIGERCVIGAGAVVLSDVPAGATVVGVPGRVLRR